MGAMRRRGNRHRGAGAGALLLASVLLLGLAAGPASASGRSDGLAQARKALLVLSDMPAGWTTAKSPNNANSNVGNRQLARCIGVATSLIAENPPSVNSKQFQDQAGTLTVNDNVSVFPSTQNAAAEYATITNPKTPRCMTALASGPLKTQLLGKPPKGVSVGTPLVSPTAAAAFGTGVAGYSLSVPFSTHGTMVNVTVTNLFAVKGRLGQQVTFTAIGLPFSIALEQHLASVAVSRL